jgi:hypothetical protein
MSDFEIDFEWPVAKYDYLSVEETSREFGHRRGFLLRALIAEVPPRLGYLVRRGALRKARPTPKAMEYAVKLLVERQKIPLHKVALTIARSVGGLLGLHVRSRGVGGLGKGRRLSAWDF